MNLWNSRPGRLSLAWFGILGIFAFILFILVFTTSEVPIATTTSDSRADDRWQQDKSLPESGASRIAAIKRTDEKPRDERVDMEVSNELHINPHNFRYIINEKEVCEPTETVSLFIFVCSSVEHFLQRQAVRETWGNVAQLDPLGVKLLFVIGSSDRPEVQGRVVEESSRYRDLIQEDFKDSYMNLTLKTVMALKWATLNCPQMSFFFKTDDDIFVNVPLLVSHVQKDGRKRWITGCIKQHSAPKPIHPDGITPPQAHPLFVAGAGYVISGDIVPAMYEASKDMRLVRIEDVFVTGHVARAIGVHPPEHNPMFSCGAMVKDDCELVYKFTGHKIKPERQYSIWDKFSSDPNPCMDF